MTDHVHGQVPSWLPATHRMTDELHKSTLGNQEEHENEQEQKTMDFQSRYCRSFRHDSARMDTRSGKGKDYSLTGAALINMNNDLGLHALANSRKNSKVRGSSKIDQSQTRSATRRRYVSTAFHHHSRLDTETKPGTKQVMTRRIDNGVRRRHHYGRPKG